ncbi:MAG: PrsW family glutamic-type intramembrane protease [Pirellulaceae bacterium]
MVVYGCLALCALVLILMVYRYDMYDKEPWYMLVLALALGMLACVAIGNFEDYLFLEFDSFFKGDYPLEKQALVVGVCEELIKLLAVAVIAIVGSRHFNDPMDGLIYGAFVGLGFGLNESLFYLGLNGATLRLDTLGETPVRLFLHLLFGGVGGFGLGLARFSKRWRVWPVIFLVCLGTSIAIHSLWDYWLGERGEDPLTDQQRQLTAITLMGILTIFFGFLVMVGARSSRSVFAPASTKKLWGWPFSLLKRNKKNRS